MIFDLFVQEILLIKESCNLTDWYYFGLWLGKKNYRTLGWHRKLLYQKRFNFCLFSSNEIEKKITKNLILGPFQALSSRLRKQECSKIIWLPGPILESKGMRAFFSEKTQKKKKKKTGKKGQKKKGQIFENWSKNVQNLKIFWNRAGDCVRLSHAINW